AGHDDLRPGRRGRLAGQDGGAQVPGRVRGVPAGRQEDHGGARASGGALAACDLARRRAMCGLRYLLTVGMVLFVALALAGCRGKKKDPEPEPEGNPLKLNQAGEAPGKNVVRRGVQMQQNKAVLESLGKYYELYRTENGRPPRTFEEFRAYIKADPN